MSVLESITRRLSLPIPTPTSSPPSKHHRHRRPSAGLVSLFQRTHTTSPVALWLSVALLAISSFVLGSDLVSSVQSRRTAAVNRELARTYLDLGDDSTYLPTRGHRDAWDGRRWFQGGKGKSRWDHDAKGGLGIRQGGWGGRGEDGRVRILFLVGQSNISLSFKGRLESVRFGSCWSWCAMDRVQRRLTWRTDLWEAEEERASSTGSNDRRAHTDTPHHLTLHLIFI